MGIDISRNAPSVYPAPTFPLQGQAEERLYDTQLPVDFARLWEKGFYPLNEIPFNSIVLNANSGGESYGMYNNNPLQAGDIARAAVQLNPDIKILAVTGLAMNSPDAIIKARQDIAGRFGVPVSNVLPVPAKMELFPKDEFMPAFGGLVKPRGNFGVKKYQRDLFSANQMGWALSQPLYVAPTIARPGDTMVVARHGERFMYAGSETIRAAAQSHNLRLDSPKAILKSIAYAMKEWRDSGNVPLKNMMFLGEPPKTLANASTPGEIIYQLTWAQKAIYDIFNKDGYPSLRQWDYKKIPNQFDFYLSILTPEQRARLGGDAFFAKLEAARNNAIGNSANKPPSRTYGDVMAQFTPAEKRAIDPQVLNRLNEMRELPFPQVPFEYHIDLVGLTLDGKSMFINESMQDNSNLIQTLKFFGFEPVALPQGRPQVESDVGWNQKLLYTSYLNAVQGRTPDGRPAILIPTEAADPQKLTENDRRAIEIIKHTLPDAEVIPVGGMSAIIGRGYFTDATGKKTYINQDWGPSCMSRVLPYVVR